MKKCIMGACLLMSVLGASAQKNVTVVGQLEGVKDGVQFMLMKTDGTGASVKYGKDDMNGVVKDGRFVLEIDYNAPDWKHYAIMSSSPGFYSQLQLDFYTLPGDTVYIKGKGNLYSGWEVTSKLPEQKEWDIIRQGAKKEGMAYEQASLDYEAYRQYRRDTEMSEAEWDSTKVILNRLDTLRKEKRIEWNCRQLEVMKTMPATAFWMDHLLTIVRSNANFYPAVADKLKELYVLRANDIDRMPDASALSSLVYPYSKAEIGKPCVDAVLYDVNGKKYRISDFKGKYVMLDFWANWCGYCIAAFPEVAKLQEKYADKLVVISLSLDKMDTWKSSRYAKEITWMNLCDGGGYNGVAKAYDVHGVPCYVLISPDGVYLDKQEGAGTEDKFLAKYLE